MKQMSIISILKLVSVGAQTNTLTTCMYLKTSNMLWIMYFVTSLFYGGLCDILEDVEDSDVRAVRTRLEEERAERLLLRNDLDILMVKVAQLERDLKDGVFIQQSMEFRTSDPVAFTARLGSHTLLDSLHVVVFDQVIHNQGDGYNSATGIFTAPITGTYIFTVSVMTVNKVNYVHLQLMVNDKEVGRVFCGDHTSNWADQGSVSVTVMVEARDQVFVREMPGLTGRLNGDNYCTFTGAVLS